MSRHEKNPLIFGPPILHDGGKKCEPEAGTVSNILGMLTALSRADQMSKT